MLNENDLLLRERSLGMIRSSIGYSSRLLDSDIKRKLRETDILVRRILGEYLDIESESRIDYWTKFCYYISIIEYDSYINIKMRERRNLLEILDIDSYYKILFRKLL